MKKIVLIALLLTVLNTSYSQAPLPVGKAQFNVGVGFSGWGVPFYLGVDYGAGKDITIGGEFTYRSYNETWSNAEYQHNIMGFSGNANYHFNRVLNIPNQFDFYAGLNLGFFIWSSPAGYGGDHSSGLGLGAQVGGRYALSRKVALNLEFGGGNASFDGKFGLTFKL